MTKTLKIKDIVDTRSGVRFHDFLSVNADDDGWIKSTGNYNDHDIIKLNFPSTLFEYFIAEDGHGVHTILRNRK